MKKTRKKNGLCQKGDFCLNLYESWGCNGNAKNYSRVIDISKSREEWRNRYWKSLHFRVNRPYKNVKKNLMRRLVSNRPPPHPHPRINDCLRLWFHWIQTEQFTEDMNKNLHLVVLTPKTLHLGNWALVCSSEADQWKNKVRWNSPSLRWKNIEQIDSILSCVCSVRDHR